MFSYFSSITVWPLLLVSSTIIFSSSGSRTWGADSLREPVVKINYIMSKSQILLGHFKDDYFIHCMTDLHDQGVSLSIFPFPPHTQVTNKFFYIWNHSLARTTKNCLTFLFCCCHCHHLSLMGIATLFNKQCTMQLSVEIFTIADSKRQTCLSNSNSNLKDRFWSHADTNPRSNSTLNQLLYQ